MSLDALSRIAAKAKIELEVENFKVELRALGYTPDRATLISQNVHQLLPELLSAHLAAVEEGVERAPGNRNPQRVFSRHFFKTSKALFRQHLPNVVMTNELAAKVDNLVLVVLKTMMYAKKPDKVGCCTRLMRRIFG